MNITLKTMVIITILCAKQSYKYITNGQYFLSLTDKSLNIKYTLEKLFDQTKQQILY